MSEQPDSLSKPPVAVLAVSDKRTIAALASALSRSGWRLYATSKTASILRPNGLPVADIEMLTGTPERFGGRIKTLNEAIFGGILFRREDTADCQNARQLGLARIDLVVCNFYPFVQAAADAWGPPDELLNLIDIGGPSMIRAAAKNYSAVLPVVDPDDYPRVIEMLGRGAPPYGGITVQERRRFAIKAFRATEKYDKAIASYLEHAEWSPTVKPTTGTSSSIV